MLFAASKLAAFCVPDAADQNHSQFSIELV
jgi:hypothetical protein